MRFNTDPAFLGHDALKLRLHEQLAEFRQWSAARDWQRFHLSHYDWWMFPVDEPSRYGFAWVVFAGDVAELRKDPEYLRFYLEGVQLQSASWGWDLARQMPIATPEPGQGWQQWPIRLYKCARSVTLFGFPELFESLRGLARQLIAAGEDMTFHGRDLKPLFGQ